jgi:hypothetical protein
MVPCEIRDRLEAQIVDAYRELSEFESPQAQRKAREKIRRLMKQRGAHVGKHGCLRDPT